MAEWISVNDRLPKIGQEVLIFARDYMGVFAYRNNRQGLSCFMYQDDSGYWREWYSPKVSHWMPLPDAPVEGVDADGG